MKVTSIAISTALALALGVAGMAPQTAHAADSGTITITGKVMNSTCDVTGNGGSSDFTVTLPPVAQSALASKDQTAGDTGFTLSLTNCPTTPTGLKVGAQFYSAANANSNGRLDNTATTGGATGVAIQLLDDGDAPITIATSQSGAAVTDQTTVPTSGTTQLSYTARYYATTAATAGNVSTTVQYVINYQ